MSRQHITRWFYLDAIWRLLATSSHEPMLHFNRFPGVDHLTGTVLEERVAIEACR